MIAEDTLGTIASGTAAGCSNTARLGTGPAVGGTTGSDGGCPKILRKRADSAEGGPAMALARLGDRGVSGGHHRCQKRLGL